MENQGEGPGSPLILAFSLQGEGNAQCFVLRYQILARCSGARHMASPDLIPNAS